MSPVESALTAVAKEQCRRSTRKSAESELTLAGSLQRIYQNFHEFRSRIKAVDMHIITDLDISQPSVQPADIGTMSNILSRHLPKRCSDRTTKQQGNRSSHIMQQCEGSPAFVLPSTGWSSSRSRSQNVSRRCAIPRHHAPAIRGTRDVSLRATPRCMAKESGNGRLSRLPIADQGAGGRGPISAEFLAVSGALATVLGTAAIAPVATGLYSSLVISGPVAKGTCVALSSFSYGLLLARFDLKKAKALRLTVAFSLLMRIICIPALSHMVAIAGYALVKLSGTKTAAAAAAAAVNAPATVKATAASLSLPAGVLSSLFLLSTTPTGYSAPAAMLSLHIHTTLLAILTALTICFFPVLPRVSHCVSLWAHRSAFLNIGATLPKVAAPPSMNTLLATTTLPFLGGLAFSRALPRRVAAVLGFLALPLSWTCSLLLLAAAVSDVVSGSVTGLAGSIGLCGGVAVMMLLLARVLASALLLDERAKRTLILYLCTQGTVIGAGVAPESFAAAPHVASALVGMGVAVIMGKVWSQVVIRTSTDVIL